MQTNREARALAFAAACVVALAAARARAEEGPCDGLLVAMREAAPRARAELEGETQSDYFEQERAIESDLTPTLRGRPWAYAALVTPECRSETRRGAAPAAAEAARAWAEGRVPGRTNRGRILLCAMQDPAALGQVDAWMSERGNAEVRAACMSALATWPGAEIVRRQVLGRAVRKRASNWQGRWEIDPAVVAAANAPGAPELSNELPPVLSAAVARQALGYDRLRDAVCTTEGTSDDVARACSTLPTDKEEEWRQSRRASRVLATSAVTAVYAGAVTMAAIERHDETGRAIATASGVPLGAVIGMGLFMGAAGSSRGARAPKPESGTARTAAAMVGGALVGGLCGGLAAHALAAKPAARAPVTAVGLALPWLAAALTFNVD